MRNKIVFICETCGKESEHKDEIFACEANHLGLTVDEALEWNRLKNIVMRCSCTVAWTRNQTTIDAYDKAVDDLISFEKFHRLIRE